MTDTPTITRELVAEKERVNHTAALFGHNFPLCLEPFVYGITGMIAEKYRGGYWHFYRLSNNGFYMAPDSDNQFRVSCENGFDGMLSADALGIVVSLYAFSHLSFGGPSKFAETCAEHYHLLREYVFRHDEVDAILRAVD